MGIALVGTSGFSYKDWRGVFYPENIKAQTMLNYYAQQFPLLELDFSYYQMPNFKAMAAMEEKTPDNFLFCVKAHKSMTHEFSRVPSEDRLNFKSFTQAMEPIRQAGKLGCLLFQFPWGFKNTQANRSYLRFIRDELPDEELIIEFRNVEWVQPAVFNYLRGLKLGFCCVDEPKLKGLFPPLVTATSELGYIRFHGRNAAKWWKNEHPWERYDYLYSREELEEWEPKILKLTGETKRTFVLFNNCHAGHAVINARMLIELLLR
ncbi:MAG TPA: DUF72 domain-containing protein [Bacillota bacterium]|jgi:uncharacterized protein YecE (DUF72 family)|nr:DUF72 domain-containing protein [Bacillota bacterium]HOL10755.1 DUF72 domain-containing protein [Bacillota bacterium]